MSMNENNSYAGHDRENARFIPGRAGWQRGMVPNLDAPWLDIAEDRVRDLFDFQQDALPPALAEFAGPGEPGRVAAVVVGTVTGRTPGLGTGRCGVNVGGIRARRFRYRPAGQEPAGPAAIFPGHGEFVPLKGSSGMSPESTRGIDPTEQENIMIPHPAHTHPAAAESVPPVSANWPDVVEDNVKTLLPDWDWTTRSPMWRAGLWLWRRLLRRHIRAQLSPEALEAVPGGCAMPWGGCPEHGDLLEYAGFANGWVCPDCGYTVQTVSRLAHCARTAVAVLTDTDGGTPLPVCDGHLRSEVDDASYGGEPVTVTYLDPRRAA